MRVNAILAHDPKYVIGSGDIIPWHVPGDFKRFKKITMGHNLLMGAKTFLGIARHYTQPKLTATPDSTELMEVLPGRTIFILGKPRNPLGDQSPDAFREIHKRGYGSDWNQFVHEMISASRDRGIEYGNLRFILDDGEPQGILDRIETNYLQKGETLFVAGGASVYDRFLPLARTIYRTIVKTEVNTAVDLVHLTDRTKVYLLELGGGPNVSCEEEDNANYYVMERV